MLEGLSIPRYLKLSDNALGADNQQERPVGKIFRGKCQKVWRAKREGFGRARLQSCRNGGKKSRGLEPPGFALLILLESSETICQIPTKSLLEKI